jgi:hypothetical protein
MTRSLSFQGSEYLGAIIKEFGQTELALLPKLSMTSIYLWSTATDIT